MSRVDQPVSPYDDQEVIGFASDLFLAYAAVGRLPDPEAAVWIGRMQFDAWTIGYARARVTQLENLRTALGGQA